MTLEAAKARLLEMADELEQVAFRLDGRCGRSTPPKVHRHCRKRFHGGANYGACRLADARRRRAAELKEIADALGA